MCEFGAVYVSTIVSGYCGHKKIPRRARPRRGLASKTVGYGSPPKRRLARFLLSEERGNFEIGVIVIVEKVASRHR
jgi:hypothetical protein